MRERDHNAYIKSGYFALFHGEMVPMSRIKREMPQMTSAIEVLIRDGKIAAQYVFTEEMEHDILLYMPSKVGEINVTRSVIPTKSTVIYKAPG